LVGRQYKSNPPLILFRRKKMDYQDIYDVGIEAIRGYWKSKGRIEFLISDTYLDVQTENALIHLGSVPYKKWKVIGLGLHCRESTAVNQAPVIHIGTVTDFDTFGIMTITATVSKRVTSFSWLETHAAGYDNLVPTTIRKGETAAQAVATWSNAGDNNNFNVEQTEPAVVCAKAIAGSISAGMFYVVVVIENMSETEYR